MQDIIGNAITLLVIIIVLALITYSNALTIKKEVKYKNKKKKQSFADNFYFIEFGKPLKIVMFIGVLFFGWLLVVNVLTYLDICVLGSGVDLSTVIIYSVIFCFYMFMFSVVVMWRVIVDDNEIFYRNYFVITKRYTFDEIDEVKETKNEDIHVYSKGKKIFYIDHMLPTGVFLICTSREKGVKVTLYNK